MRIQRNASCATLTNTISTVQGNASPVSACRTASTVMPQTVVLPANFPISWMLQVNVNTVPRTAVFAQRLTLASSAMQVTTFQAPCVSLVHQTAWSALLPLRAPVVRLDTTIRLEAALLVRVHALHAVTLPLSVPLAMSGTTCPHLEPVLHVQVIVYHVQAPLSA